MPPPFMRARSLVLYESKVIEAVRALKYKGQRGLAPLLGRWMAEALPDLMGGVRYDCLVPVPLHWRRRWERGFNQAELLTVPIAAALGVSLEECLARGRATRKQARLGQKERQENLSDAFFVPREARQRVKDATLLIVDDVFTTGATTAACARCLIEAGAGRVDVLTFARAA